MRSEVLVENHRAKNSLPAFLRFTPDLLYDNVPSEQNYEIRANCHLEFIHNDFLVYRLLERRTGSISEELLCTARDALSLLLAFLSRQLRHPQTRKSVHAWNVCNKLPDTPSETISRLALRICLLRRH